MSTMGQLIGMLACAGVIAVAVSQFSDQPEQQQTARVDTARIADAPSQPEPAQSLHNAAVLRREDDGHYWALSDVDGTSVKFLVDTGASTVALTYDDARRLGLDPDNLSYSWAIRTAGGETRGASVVLNSIRIGNVEVQNVEAMVLRDGLDQSLLGMSFLGELYSYEFKRRSLIIRQ